MAIREKIITIEADGEDKGKRFRIRRMNAIDGDRWGCHCIKALVEAGKNIHGLNPDDGLAGVAAMGIELLNNMARDQMDDLNDRLMECVKFLPNDKDDSIEIDWKHAGNTGQFTDLKTPGVIRSEAFSLHVDFFKGAQPLFYRLFTMLLMGSSDPAPDTATSQSELAS